MTTVLIADDHAVVADGLGSLLERRFLVVGRVHDGRALLEATRRLRPDVILTDISMPELNGLEAIEKIKEYHPSCGIVILTMHDEPELAARAFRRGASGYVLKNSPLDELVKAIEEVHRGGEYLSPLIASGSIRDLLATRKDTSNGAGRLTARQLEVLQLVAEGRTMKEIANLLHISPRTVESHKYEMMNVLGITTSAELVQHAVRIRLVSW